MQPCLLFSCILIPQTVCMDPWGTDALKYLCIPKCGFRWKSTAPYIYTCVCLSVYNSIDCCRKTKLLSIFHWLVYFRSNIEPWTFCFDCWNLGSTMPVCDKNAYTFSYVPWLISSKSSEGWSLHNTFCTGKIVIIGHLLGFLSRFLVSFSTKEIE